MLCVSSCCCVHTCYSVDIWMHLRGRRGLMVVGFTTTCAISALHHWSCEFKSRSGEVCLIKHYVVKFICACDRSVAVYALRSTWSQLLVNYLSVAPIWLWEYWMKVTIETLPVHWISYPCFHSQFNIANMFTCSWNIAMSIYQYLVSLEFNLIWFLVI